ncbi:hypothetical protein CH372_15325 [Leptospira meyeri]|uniref:hypothetical protein n=1 Tax=Leptospira meyeri TaxID=29508 RepID=UPI000C2A70AE|nr:hypothetical protein [Leptospira meyeri]PKA11209.1 hypothetical protein CH372_15325 [Leptospira meyeri]
MKTFETKYLENLIKEFDVKDNMASPKLVNFENATKFSKAYISMIQPLSTEKFCVVGLDILGYSQYNFEKQSIIPSIFDLLMSETLRHTIENESLIFQHENETKLTEKFISTGDGGFQVLENPLQGLIFSLNFASMLHLFNAYSLYPSIRHFLGELKVRYCLTYDNVFKFKNNYYGAAIINNHRIMSKDKLDRCLLDKNYYTWFLEKTNGLESLPQFTYTDIAKKLSIPAISLPLKKGTFITDIFHSEDEKPSLRNIISQKIGHVKAKEQILDVYNLFVQIEKSYKEESTDIFDNYTVNLGNLNTAGLLE